VELDPDALGLTEIIQLQTRLSESLKRRFEKDVALAFSDIVGSTTYFAAHGDEAGRRLQQLHADLVARAASAHEGRVVDYAGDGAFLAFPTPTHAARALMALQEDVAKKNALTQREHRLLVRCGIHFGPVLTDGVIVTGDSVNLCSRIAGTAAGSEIRVSKAAFGELDKELRLRCVGLPAVALRGVTRPVEVMTLRWLDRELFPASVRIRESGEQIALPEQDTITFGRLREQAGIRANDVVLAVEDKAATQQVSRWHFELRRKPGGFVLRSVTDQSTVVDGVPVAKGGEASISTRSIVVVANVMTLEFQVDPRAVDLADESEATAYGV
jgi:class 3 adenylate cyclase